MLPEAFTHRMRVLLGPAEADALCLALTETEPPVSIRRNPAKAGAAPLAFPLAEALGPTAACPDVGALADASARSAGAAEKPVPWCAWGRYLPERPAFALDPRWHAGAYYVQEAASMFVAAAYRAAFPDVPPRRVLDLCAAPGGKSTLWRSLLPDDALLVANEPVKARANILAENLTKWGHPATVVANAYPVDFAPLPQAFDLIAADVPCSGEGMFRKDEQARAEWSPEAVARCAERQREILRDVWPALREGGVLVYSTCTFNREENEDIVRFVISELGAEPLAVPCDPAWGIVGDTAGGGLPVSHFFPHRTAGEGLFMAVLRKTPMPSRAPGAVAAFDASALPSAEEEHATFSRKSLTFGAESPTFSEKSATARRKDRAKDRGRRAERTSRGDRKAKAAPTAAAPAECAAWLRSPDAFVLRCLPDGRIVAVPRAHADFTERLAAVARLLVTGVTVAETRGPKVIPHTALALSTALAPDAFPRVPLSLVEARAFLRREALVLPPDVPRGHVLATFDGLPLGWLNNLGTRANNLYPAEWRLRTAAR